MELNVVRVFHISSLANNEPKCIPRSKSFSPASANQKPSNKLARQQPWSQKRGYMNVLCFALPCYPLSAAVSSEGREKGTQICSTSLLARPWQKSSELLGLLINMPSGQAARAMKLCRGKGVVDIFKHISEFSKFRSSCSDNQLLFSLSSHSC